MIGEHHIWEKLINLGLDENQKEVLKEILRNTMRETIKKQADLDIAQIDLKDLLDKDAVDMKTVESKLNQIASLETEIHLARIKAHEEIKSKLTPDQRKKLKAIMEQGMMMGKMGMMQGKGCGMMREMMGGAMKHGNIETALPSAEKGEGMPSMHHGN
jgi:Spy/CpxP family protein refolding chaperone